MSGNKDLEGLGACQASPATACSPSGSSPVPGLAADALRPTGAAHTPGPWRLDGNGPSDAWGARENEDRCELATIPHPTFDAFDIYGSRARDDFAEHEANARLIAAAPDLYDALNELEARVADYRMKHDLKGDGSPEAGRAWDLMKRAQVKARAALLQAEGR